MKSLIQKSSLCILSIIILVSMSSCSKDEPYEKILKKRIIENMNIEPIIETVIIDSKLDSAVLKSYYIRELENKRKSDKEFFKSEFEKAKNKYDFSLKHEGKHIADGVYLRYVTEAKENYDMILSGKNDSSFYSFYYDRIRYPTIFEEITVKLRLSKDGSLLVQRYRTDIFKGDTAFYELNAGETISDYIK